MKIISYTPTKIQSFRVLNPVWDFRLLIAVLTICSFTIFLWHNFTLNGSYYVYGILIIFLYFYTRHHVTWMQYFQTQAALGYGKTTILNIRTNGLYLSRDKNKLIYFLPWELIQLASFKNNHIMLLNNNHRVLFFLYLPKKIIANIQTKINQYITTSTTRKRINNSNRKKLFFASECSQITEFYSLRFKESYKTASKYATLFTISCILSFPIFIPFTEFIGALLLGLIMMIITQSFWKLAYDSNVKFSSVKTDHPSIYFDITRHNNLLCYYSDGSFLRIGYQDIKQIIIAKHLKLIQLNGGALIPCDKNIDLSFLGNVQTKSLIESKKWLFITNISYFLFPCSIFGSYLLVSIIKGIFLN